jgi:hypothetical protein
MISPIQVRKQLDKIGIGNLPLCRAELKELPLLLIPGEEIESLLAGRYVSGYAIMVATNHRLLIVDKKFGGGLIFEDIPYDMIAEVQFVHTPLATQLTVHARSKQFLRRYCGVAKTLLWRRRKCAMMTLT